jgi:ring-1,2-phenylacetyl-CoA epoxidase subunit PaaA/ring-1,2-phenylacetyl-CoA epoxidase subunit PaaC
VTTPDAAGLATLVRRLAEAKHVLGHRLATAALSAPALEAAVAGMAIAQEELGHARLLYACELRLRGGGDPAGPRGDDTALAHEVRAAPPDLALVDPLDDWLPALAALATLDTGVTLWLTALAGGAEPWLASRAARMVDDETAHAAFTAAWLDVVAGAPALATRLAPQLAAARDRHATWMAGAGRDVPLDRLALEGVAGCAALSGVALPARYRAAVDALLPPALKHALKPLAAGPPAAAPEETHARALP